MKHRLHRKRVEQVLDMLFDKVKSHGERKETRFFEVKVETVSLDDTYLHNIATSQAVTIYAMIAQIGEHNFKIKSYETDMNFTAKVGVDFYE